MLLKGKDFVAQKTTVLSKANWSRNLLEIVSFNIVVHFVGFICSIMLEYMNDFDYSNMCTNCTYPQV